MPAFYMDGLSLTNYMKTPRARTLSMTTEKLTLRRTKNIHSVLEKLLTACRNLTQTSA